MLQVPSARELRLVDIIPGGGPSLPHHPPCDIFSLEDISIPFNILQVLQDLAMLLHLGNPRGLRTFGDGFHIPVVINLSCFVCLFYSCMLLYVLYVLYIRFPESLSENWMAIEKR